MTRALIFACLVAAALGQDCVTTNCDSIYAKCQNCSTFDPLNDQPVPGGLCYDRELNDPANIMPQDCTCVENFAKCIDGLEKPGTCTKSSLTAQNLKERKDQCFNPKTQKFPVPEIANYQEQCTVEVLFLVDLSSSIDAEMKPGNVRNNIKLRSFVAEIMVAIESSVGKAKFSLSYFMGLAERRDNEVPGFILSADGVDTMFDLSELPKEGDGSTTNILETLMDNRREPYMALGATPTSAAFERASEQIENNGDPSVQQRLTILLTDGTPTQPLNVNAPADLRDKYWISTGKNADGTEIGLDIEGMSYATDAANDAVEKLKKNTLLMSVGINLNTKKGEKGQELMNKWASEPKTLLAQPKVEFDELPLLIPKILVLLCPVIVNELKCLEQGVYELTIKGRGFLKTNETECLFRDNIEENGRDDVRARGRFVDNKTIVCIIIPEGGTPEYPKLFPGNYTSYYKQNFFVNNFTKAIPFLFGTLCNPVVLGYWRPFFALLLLPLAFARRSKAMPATTVTKTVAAPPAQSTPQVVEEFAEYEEVEELEVIRPATNKWKVAPTAYIGFGKARMSVDWAGVAPASAPHEGVRKKVVVKRATGPKPADGAGGDVPLPAPGAPETAPGEEVTETTVEPGAGEFVEEPDWVNGFLDGISSSGGKMCGCCKK